MTTAETETAAATSELELRSAQVVSVSYPQRTVEVVVMPYEQPAEVAYHGRMIQEVCSRGAFDGIERRANRVKVNRDHDWRRVVGRAISWHPSRDEGLVGELSIARTPLGDETLALADEGILDASAGFMLLREPGTQRAKRGAETWERNRTVRRLHQLWLDHVALTPDAAYESANVLAVRSDTPLQVSAGADTERAATPRLDALRAELRAEQLLREYEGRG